MGCSSFASGSHGCLIFVLGVGVPTALVDNKSPAVGIDQKSGMLLIIERESIEGKKGSP
jgi:hypothetical protein